MDKIAPPIAAGLAVALVGSFLLPRLNEQFKGRREHLNDNVQDILEELEIIQERASEYWTKKAGPVGTVEAEIEFRLAKLNSLLTSISEDLWPGRPGMPADLYASFVSDVVTADFGTRFRKPEPDRGRLIAGTAGGLASELLIRRRAYFHHGDGRRALIRGWFRMGRLLGNTWRDLKGRTKRARSILASGSKPKAGSST